MANYNKSSYVTNKQKNHDLHKDYKYPQPLNMHPNPLLCAAHGHIIAKPAINIVPIMVLHPTAHGVVTTIAAHATSTCAFASNFVAVSGIIHFVHV